MKRCAILSMDNLDGYEVHDGLLDKPLKNAGWETKTISWRAENIDWNQFDLVMIRSTWDYQLDSEKFLNVLHTIDNSTAHLENSINIVKWNINKKYLRELEQKKIQIVPTLWLETFNKNNFSSWFEKLSTNQIVVKPCISAGAFDTFRITKAEHLTMVDVLAEKFEQRAFMVQPFVPSIVDEGEFSIFYFDGEYSHCILKKPKLNDFRVQEEFGGFLSKVTPESELKEQAESILKVIDTPLLYARFDFVRWEDNFALMEAELIEPSLYFNLDSEAPKRYVDAMERRMNQLAKK